MPRARTGNGNRTDLNTPDQPTRLPVTAAENQPYGVAGEQLAAQRAVPEGSEPAPTLARSPGTMLPMRDVLAQAAPQAGSLPFLDPTNRPNEPVTHGLPFGPGAGPEAMNNLNAPVSPVSEAFSSMTGPNSSRALASVADVASVLGL